MNTRVRLADWAMTTECLGIGSIPLTGDLVSLLPGVRQACAVGCADLGIVALAHAGALEFDPECAVNDAVEDRVADCVVADHVVPPSEGDLASDQKRAPLVAIVDNLQKITPLFRVQRLWPPIIDDQQACAFQHCHET
jgi:hypothetical protein